ncbi:hypothetical protein Salat_2298800 [Sesamum alatum]|uniref:Uncharacterized protein n=1 Tax=Sesamum alatum TaxID=300844 RepID=A0AAE1XVK1_9LAMI|nr:hypothetical protein Salat_2298800 [Sesamum alatum]
MGSSSTVEFDHQKSFRIKHDDDKFLSRLLSKETSKSNPSFRVYYGDHVPSAVPFMWETRPGTPKHTSSDNSYNIPPLTPPPSYYTNNNFTNSTSNKYYSRSKLLFHTFLRRMNPKKTHSSASSHSPTSSSSFSSLSWSSSSRSSFSDPVMTPTYVHKRRRTSSWSYSFDKSCFGIDKEMINGERVQVQLQRGCSVKKAFLSIVGRRSA